jgi:hypothetical protein
MNFIKRYRTVFQLGLLLVGAVALISPQARAESCEMRIGQSELDFGQLRHPGAQISLDERNLYPLGTRHVALNASCPASTKLLLLVRGDSLAERFRFAAGQLRVRLSNALLDGRAVNLATIRVVGEVPSAPASTIDVAPGDLVVPVSAWLAAEGTLLSMQIEVSPDMSLEEFKTRDRKTLEGHLSFEVRQY